VRPSIRATALAAVIATSSAAPPTQAAEIRLLSAAAMQTVFHMITDVEKLKGPQSTAAGKTRSSPGRAVARHPGGCETR
jgi:hypothetical protein